MAARTHTSTKHRLEQPPTRSEGATKQGHGKEPDPLSESKGILASWALREFLARRIPKPTNG